MNNILTSTERQALSEAWELCDAHAAQVERIIGSRSVYRDFAQELRNILKKIERIERSDY